TKLAKEAVKLVKGQKLQNTSVKTWPEFQKRFKGQFKTREDASIAWKSYKKHHGIKPEGQLRVERRKNPNTLHGNMKSDKLEATLYQRVDKEGNHMKWGVSKNPKTRYSKKELIGHEVKGKKTGPRDEVLSLERKLTERYPGPMNKEPWAGKRIPKGNKRK